MCAVVCFVFCTYLFISSASLLYSAWFFVHTNSYHNKLNKKISSLIFPGVY